MCVYILTRLALERPPYNCAHVTNPHRKQSCLLPPRMRVESIESTAKQLTHTHTQETRLSKLRVCNTKHIDASSTPTQSLQPSKSKHRTSPCQLGAGDQLLGKVAVRILEGLGAFRTMRPRLSFCNCWSAAHMQCPESTRAASSLCAAKATLADFAEWQLRVIPCDSV